MFIYDKFIVKSCLYLQFIYFIVNYCALSIFLSYVIKKQAVFFVKNYFVYLSLTHKFMLVPSIQNKIEYYCAYQERCHDEVISKLKSYQLSVDEIDEYLVHLIENNYLNEERFACSFVRGKHNIKKWGKIRLINELKFKNISKYNIDIALKELSSESYFATFTALAEKEWETIRETNIQKRNVNFVIFYFEKAGKANWFSTN